MAILEGRLSGGGIFFTRISFGGRLVGGHLDHPRAHIAIRRGWQLLLTATPRAVAIVFKVWQFQGLGLVCFVLGFSQSFSVLVVIFVTVCPVLGMPYQ